MTFGILKALSFVMALRPATSEEGHGMDIVNHGEEAYTDGEGAILLLDDEMVPAPVAVPAKRRPAMA